MGQWIQISHQNSSGAAGIIAPIAPTSATLLVVDSDDGFSLYTGWVPADPYGGTIGYQRQAAYYADDGAATEIVGWTTLGDHLGATDIEDKSGPYPKPTTVVEYARFRTRAYNANGDVTDWVYSSLPLPVVPLSSGFSVSPPVEPQAGTITVTIDAGGFTLHPSWTPPVSFGSTTGNEVEVRYFTDTAGTTPVEPDADKAWILLGRPGIDKTVDSSGPYPIPDTIQYVGARFRAFNVLDEKTDWVYSVAPFPSVCSLGVPGANLISSLVLAVGAGGSFPFNQITADGSQYWSIATVTVDDAGALVDSNARFLMITAQDLDATGSAVGPEQPWDSCRLTGAEHVLGPLMGAYGTDGYSYTRSGNIAVVRFRLYVGNDVDVSASAYTNSTATTLQTGLGSGAGYVDVTVAATGAVPTGKLVATRLEGEVPGPNLPLGEGMKRDGSNIPVTNLPQFTVVSGEYILNTRTVGANELKLANVSAENMAASAITHANGALAAQAIYDSNVHDVNISKFTAGTNIFTGDVILSRGYGVPVLVMNNAGLLLYSASSPSTGVDGLTSSPYVGITSEGVLCHSGSSKSVMVNSTGVFLYSVNGSTASPFVQLGSNSLLMQYNSTIKTTLDANGLKILNGTYSVVIGGPSSPVIQLWSVDGNNAYPFVGINDSHVYIGQGAPGGASSKLVTIDSDGLTIANGESTAVFSSTSITFNVPGHSASAIIQADGSSFFTTIMANTASIWVLTVGDPLQVGTAIRLFGGLSGGTPTIAGYIKVNINGYAMRLAYYPET